MKLLSFFLACALTIFSCSPGNRAETKTESEADNSAVKPIPSPREAIITQYDSSFKSFIEVCKEPDTRLPEWARTIFLEAEPIGRITSQGLLDIQPAYALLYIHTKPVGPGIDELHIASFSHEGKKISDLRVGANYPSAGPDGSGESYTIDAYNTDHHTLYMTNRITDWNEKDKEEFTYEYATVYPMDEFGKITAGRKYLQASQRPLTTEELSAFSKDELRIMRNEIFASYGYIFKTEPLKSYYASLQWYYPENENVDKMLNEFEKRNVRMIRNEEERK